MQNTGVQQRSPAAGLDLGCRDSETLVTCVHTKATPGSSAGQRIPLGRCRVQACVQLLARASAAPPPMHSPRTC